MKKFLCAVLAAGMIIAASSAAFAGSSDITVILDGTTLNFDVKPQIINDRTMVPMRAVFEALGASVEWDGGSRKITSVKGGTTVEMTVDDYTMYINGKGVSLDAAPCIDDNRTLVPVRAIAEGLNADVSWVGDSKTVMILSDAKDTVVRAKINIKDRGEISLALFGNIAPKTVENFKNLASSGFYNDLIFHRTIFGFMIQGGGYDLSLTEKESERVVGEFASNGVNNPLKHTRGVISMARRGSDYNGVAAKDSASSQFFIMHEDAEYLDGEYAAFGIVTGGMDVVDSIAEIATARIDEMGMEDLPVEPVIIESVTIE